MSGSTVYDVKVRYALDDKTSKSANNMAGSLDRAGRSAFSLRGAIAGLGIAGVFAAGKKTLIDFNSEIDQMRIGMTTIMNMQLKKPWDEASKSADRLFVRFQEMAKKSPATTKDFITMANAITPVVASMGGGEDKIAKLTQGAVIAGLATGTRSDVAALDVKQMLLGIVTERDMMSNQLLASKGVDKGKFNAMSGAARMAMVESMLSDPALLRAADEFGKSFAGQVSTFQDQLQMALGSVGKPLMASLTAEVQKWNNWIEKHPRTIATISAKIGGMLKSSFEFIAKTTSWLVDNKETLLMIGKVFLAFKGAQIATGLIGGFARGVTNMVAGLKNAEMNISKAVGTGGGAGLIGSFGRMSSVLTAAGGVIPGLIGLGAAAWQLWDILGQEGKGISPKQKAADDLNFEAMREVGPKASRMHELSKLLDGKSPMSSKAGEQFKGGPELFGRLSTEYNNLKKEIAKPETWVTAIKGMDEARAKLNQPTFKDQSFADIDKQTQLRGGLATEKMHIDLMLADAQITTVEHELAIATLAFRTLSSAQKLSALQETYGAQFWPGGVKPEVIPDAAATKGPGAGTPAKVNVTIQRIEVASDDPDRFVFGMVKAFEKAARNPTQAASALGG